MVTMIKSFCVKSHFLKYNNNIEQFNQYKSSKMFKSEKTSNKSVLLKFLSYIPCLTFVLCLKGALFSKRIPFQTGKNRRAPRNQ